MFHSNAYLFEYGQKAVKNSRQNSSNRNLFAAILHETEKDQPTLTDLDVILEAGNLIVAGSHTTAHTLTWLIWAVLSQQKLQQQLEEEVGALDDDFDEAALEDLPLLNAAISENLRLYGAAPGSLPQGVLNGGATLSGHFILAGITVSTQSWTIHRDENLFPNTETFDVSPWLPGSNQVSDKAKAAYSPFGVGARNCVGIRLAWMELRLAAAEFFRECKGVRLSPRATPESMKPENYFTIAPVGHRCGILANA